MLYVERLMSLVDFLSTVQSDSKRRSGCAAMTAGMIIEIHVTSVLSEIFHLLRYHWSMG